MRNWKNAKLIWLVISHLIIQKASCQVPSQSFSKPPISHASFKKFTFRMDKNFFLKAASPNLCFCMSRFSGAGMVDPLDFAQIQSRL